MNTQELRNEMIRSGALSGWFDEAIKEGTALYNKAKPVVKKAVVRGANQAVKNSQPIVEDTAIFVIDKLIDAIPNQQQMEALGRQISILIIEQLDNNVVPSLFKQQRDFRALGLPQTESPLLFQTYTDILTRIPTRVSISFAGVNLNLNLKQAFKKALPFKKFVVLSEKFEPLTQEVQKHVLPAVEQKAKQVAGFTVISSMLVGGLLTFGYIRLYDSAKKLG